MRPRYLATVAALALAGLAGNGVAQAQTSTKTTANQASPMPKLTIYHAEGRRSERIIWFAEEVGLPYELVFVSGDLMGSLKKIKEVNPIMTVAPTIKYGDLVMIESGAILQLLQQRHAPGKLAPALDSPDYPKFLQWLHFAEGSAAPRFTLEYMLKSVEGGKLPPVAQSRLGRSDQVLSYLEEWLTQHPYFGGAEFSIADIMMQFNIQFLELVVKKDLTPYPKFVAWQKTIEARPAFKKMRQVALPNGFIGVPK